MAGLVPLRCCADRGCAKQTAAGRAPQCRKSQPSRHSPPGGPGIVASDPAPHRPRRCKFVLTRRLPRVLHCSVQAARRRQS
eukprot:7384460-Prymnesium_polylepis.5